jgi:hypothetical protein
MANLKTVKAFEFNLDPPNSSFPVMKIHIHKSLEAYLDEALYGARLRRNGTGRDRHAVLAEILAEAEAAGDAMRYLDKRRRVAWRATPQLRELLRELQADAKADAEAEDM